MGVNVRLETSRLDEMTAEARPKASRIVAETAFEAQAEIQINAPVDTGTLRNSIEAERVSDLTWSLHDGVEYGVFVELGTSKMAAQPFFTPGIESKRQKFNDRFKELFE